MRLPERVLTASVGSLLLAIAVCATPTFAQAPAATESGAAAAGETPPAKPKPKPKPRPKPKPAPAAEVPAAMPADAKAPDTAPSGLDSADQPRTEKPVGPSPLPALSAPKPDQAGEPAAALVPNAMAGPGVVCDPGQGVLYDGPNDFSFWVTRSGAVQIDNPLRPLTPEVTRVLQLVIADKIATIYGPDYTAMRRGGAPGLVEGALGGPIRWDAKLGGLPDTLDIVSDSGDPLAQMRFKECGEAPAAKALPVAVKKGGKRGNAAPDPASPEAAVRYPAPPGATRPPARRLPQGAIPE